MANQSSLCFSFLITVWRNLLYGVFKTRGPHLHCHCLEVFPSLSNHVSQSEDGTQRVVFSVTVLQVGVIHVRKNVPPDYKLSQF